VLFCEVMPASAPWNPPGRRSLAGEAGRDHGCRQANEAVLPFSILHEAVIVAAVWGYRPLAPADPREVRVTRFLFGMKPAPTPTDLEGHTR
jgi:hypothetical protein